jgi:predicted DNA-binding transcriptional regulator AlpA
MMKGEHRRLPMDRQLKEREVMEIRGCGRTKLWQDVRAGLFPAPVYDGPRTKRWFESEVAAHQEALKATRDAKV